MTESEIELIRSKLNRNPTDEELKLFEALWSEHASYKSSRKHLKKLPRSADWVVCGPGENAGAVSIDGHIVVFKVESHNHPSYIDPYNGSATGVGGIIRDVLALGARPLALADFLCFGSPDDRKMRYLVRKVVEGISDYGNSVGIPTTAGQTSFFKFFQKNILVNVMCIGVVEDRKPISSKPKSKGKVVYIGAKTGADGIGGTVMASQTFEGEVRRKRYAVQIGDPFTEKCLVEAVLEMKPYIRAMQDMGAAGLLNSTTEVAHKGGFGIKINLDKIPKRQPLSPLEMLLSESQERMLAVMDENDIPKAKKICQKWSVECEEIGELTDSGRYEVWHNRKKVFDLPLDVLLGAPELDRPTRKPRWLDDLENFKVESLPEPEPDKVMEKFFSSPNIASKRWVWEQYDWCVMARTVVEPGSDFSAIKLDDRNAVVFTLDGNPLRCLVNPKTGAELVVLEAMRNITCAGAIPLAITDNLNFGSPENPEVMWQFVQTVNGLANACSKIQVPVVSGNVSFYNESEGTPIPPTPVVGMVGKASLNTIREGRFYPDLLLVAVGELYPLISASAYLWEIWQKVGGKLPEPNYDAEIRTAKTIRELLAENAVEAVRDVSDGGILLCVFEGAEAGGSGFKLSKFIKDRWDFWVFSECYPLFICAVKEENLEKLMKICAKNKVPYRVIGKTTEKDIIEIEGVWSAKMSDVEKLWHESGLQKVMG